MNYILNWSNAIYPCVSFRWNICLLTYYISAVPALRTLSLSAKHYNHYRNSPVILYRLQKVYSRLWFNHKTECQPIFNYICFDNSVNIQILPAGQLLPLNIASPLPFCLNYHLTFLFDIREHRFGKKHNPRYISPKMVVDFRSIWHVFCMLTLSSSWPYVLFIFQVRLKY